MHIQTHIHLHIQIHLHLHIQPVRTTHSIENTFHIQAVRIGEVDAEKLSGISDDDLNKVQGQKMKAYSVYKQDVSMCVPPPSPSCSHSPSPSPFPSLPKKKVERSWGV